MDAEEAKRQYVALLDKVSQLMQPLASSRAERLTVRYPDVASADTEGVYAPSEAATPQHPAVAQKTETLLQAQAQPEWENHPALKDYKPE